MTEKDFNLVKAKYWCFTSFNLEDKWDKYVSSRGNETVPTYYIYGIETAPETGKKHQQGYIEFPRQLTGRELKKHWPKVHFEPRRGTAEQAADYCRKVNQGEDVTPNEEVYEFGVMSDGGKPGERTDIQRIADAILKEGKSIEYIVNETDLASNYQCLRHAEALLKYSRFKRDWKTEVTWIYGPTGSGKTRLAWEEATAAGGTTWHSARDLQWWDGYSGHDNVIIDDFRGNQTTLADMLRILDRYPYNVPVKGGFTPLLARRIWITSPFHPTETYRSTGEDMNQFVRRMGKIVHLDSKSKVQEPIRLQDPNYVNEC